MAEIGTVLVSSVGPNKDQILPVRLCKCTMSSDDDIQTIQLAGSLDDAPVVGTQLLIFDVGQAFKIGFVLNDFVLPAAVIGEQWIYSYIVGGITMATIKCKVDGGIEILGLLGWVTIDGITGQVNINNNLTVDLL